ncbi:MAG: hypothetical protein U5N86_11860 [Planctomycetota bacterium]|nr:hypothetical protein [Planctomycetota bacterium]
MLQSQSFAVRGIEAHLGRGELVIAAMGKAQFVKGQWLKKGAVVIDVGTDELEVQTDEGKKTKSINDVTKLPYMGTAKAVTPVPGGVGTLTTAILFENLLKAIGSR